MTFDVTFSTTAINLCTYNRQQAIHPPIDESRPPFMNGGCHYLAQTQLPRFPVSSAMDLPFIARSSTYSSMIVDSGTLMTQNYTMSLALDEALLHLDYRG